jgi:protein associated with RNAse G/E
MNMWNAGDTIVIRYIARSDGSVAMAIPAIVIRDDDLLATYVPAGTRFVDNWVVPEAERVTAVATIKPSSQRQHQELTWHTNTIRLYLAGKAFSVWLFFAEDGQLSAWYGNLEAPFVRTPLGIDTRDHGLDVVASPDGTWRWKDEAEFVRRLELGVDTFGHQTAVRAAGEEFIHRLQHRTAPFDQGWENWQPPVKWQPRQLPSNWNFDFGTHAALA